MLVLIPPSETKRSGGDRGTRLDLAALRFGELTRRRRACVAAVRRLARDAEATIAALGLGPRQHGEVDVNRRVAASPLLPAAERYTGVLYEALGADGLAAAERDFLGDHVVIHSALFGPVGALDPLPAYRLSHDSRLPGMPLRRHWAHAVSTALAATGEFVLDARSGGYARLGPAPAGVSALLRVVAELGGGRRRTLGHVNKQTKGALVRALARDRADCADAGEFIEWGRSRGFGLEPGAGPDEILLVV